MELSWLINHLDSMVSAVMASKQLDGGLLPLCHPIGSSKTRSLDATQHSLHTAEEREEQHCFSLPLSLKASSPMFGWMGSSREGMVSDGHLAEKKEERSNVPPRPPLLFKVSVALIGGAPPIRASMHSKHTPEEAAVGFVSHSHIVFC